MNKQTLFAYLRRSPFNGLSQSQVNGVNAILDMPWGDDRFAAYALATVFHETGGTMSPVRETFAKSDSAAVANLERAFKAGRLKSVKTPYWRVDKDGKSWFGRGLVQLTHRRNYEAMSKFVGVDLVKNPSLALDMKISAKILYEGMTRGTYTGKKLSGYFNSATDNPVGARRIINGTDKAKLIATHYTAFLGAIQAAKVDIPPEDVAEDMAKPDDVKASESGVVKTILTTGGGGVAYSVLQSVNNPWAMGFAVFITAIIAVGAWAYFTGRISFNRAK